MRILLDENLSPSLWKEFPGHMCESALFAGMAGLKNGQLIAAAIERGVNVLVTIDKSIPSQNYLSDKPLAVDVLRPSGPGLASLRDLLPLAREILNHIQPGQVRVVSYLDLRT